MPRTCRVIGSTNATASRYSAYCLAHKTRLRRHGSVVRRGIREGGLRPVSTPCCGEAGEEPREPNLGPAGDPLGGIEAHSRAILGKAADGRPVNTYELTAPSELHRVADGADATDIIDARPRDVRSLPHSTGHGQSAGRCRPSGRRVASSPQARSSWA